MNDHVDWWQCFKQYRSRDLAQPALEKVALDRGFAVLGNNDTNTQMPETRKGSAHPNIKMFGSKALPCSRNCTQLRAAGDAAASRKVSGRMSVVLRAATAVGAYAPAYLVGSRTVSCFRPFLRRRASTSRPHLSDIRRRKPWVRIRRLFRGR